VTLEEIISMDNTLLELADMYEGFCAKRQSKQDKWNIEKQSEG
jgi:hypothetical protein